MLKISANDAQLTVVACGPITSDRIDLPCEITLSKEFDGLAVTVVFKAGDVQRDVAMLGSPVHVPAECLEQAGEVLMVGIWAGDGSGRPTIPTVWASAGTIRTGVLPSGYDPDEPEPDWAAQVQQYAQDAHDTAERLAAEVDGWEREIDAAVQGAENVDAVASKSGTTATITVTDREGVEHTVTVSDGAQGEAGRDGYSPSATVTQGDGSATITITDKDGTTTATVHDGADGRDGRDGTDGVDGFSPTATVTQTASGATISITDKSGTTTASVSNGTDGTDGTDGVDGFSPTVDVQPITGGHEVTITDADGAHSFDVLDGDPATPGSITDEMLAPDGVKAQVAQLWGNQLVGELSGTIATAADAHAAPPMALSVDGNSTQAGTPTPDAPVPIRSVSGKNLLPDTVYQLAEDRNAIVAGANFRSMWCKVEPSTKYTISRSVAKGNRFGVYTTETEPAAGVALTLIKSPLTEVGVLSFTFITPADARYVFIYLANDGTDVSGSDMQLERGSVATPYVPYGNIALVLAGKNLLDEANNIVRGYFYANTPKISAGGTSIYAPIVGGETYTVSGGNGNRRSMNFTEVLPEVDAALLGGADLPNNYSAQTFTAPANAKYVVFYIDSKSDKTPSGYQLEAGSTATAYALYVEPTTVSLYDGTLRSLPDGTKDQLNLSYLRPSTRPGWAWYSREVTKSVQAEDMGDIAWTYITNWRSVNVFRCDIPQTTSVMCTSYPANASAYTPDDDSYLKNVASWRAELNLVVRDDSYTNVADFVAAVAGQEIHYALATPVTTTIDPIELPELPAPDCTVWCDGGSATPTYQMQYVQDTNIVIADLRAALADLATS